MQPYIARKRLDEIIKHSEDESWEGEDYPIIGFVLRDYSAKNSFLFTTRKKLDDMGLDENELPIVATSLKALSEPTAAIWATPYKSKQISHSLNKLNRAQGDDCMQATRACNGRWLEC